MLRHFYRVIFRQNEIAFYTIIVYRRRTAKNFKCQVSECLYKWGVVAGLRIEVFNFKPTRSRPVV